MMLSVVTSILAAVSNKSESIPAELILFILIAAIVLILFITIAKRYKRCPANKILVVYGKTGSGAARCVHGGAAFIWPLFQAYDFLDLEPFVVPIDLSNALSQENIRVSVPTTVTAAISNVPGVMENAAVRLLGLGREQIQDQAQDIILGQMRAVIATMGIEEINRDRQAFMGKVNEAVSMELEKIGLQVINVNIRDIQDESGYIKALGRKAAAEAINQANIDVAEQEKTGETGVAERKRDTRVAVAAANATADIGEATANRDKRQKVAGLEAEAVEAETQANAKKAAYNANQNVAEQQARQRSESASREADGAVRVAQENAQKKAEDARALREQSRLNAEMIVPANAEKQRVVINADAQKEQAIRIAEGQAQATIAKMSAEGKGVQAILDGKAEGYQRLVESCGGDKGAAALLLIEKLIEVANVQAKAIQNLPIEKVFVWDGGGETGGMKNLGQRIMGALPPMHELAKQVGLDLPEFLGKLHEEAKKTQKKTPPAEE
ncbi:MAG: flotillin family protein [Phycisphaerae bacterium]|nr:flotillin family protein [Phycisphaerae bacterium]